MFLKPPQKAQPVKHVIDPALQPWVEKYRPKTMDEVSSQDHAVSVLKKTLLSTNLPHMLFYGPPGTGKTSTILALSRELFGPDHFRHRVLELNASDERGIAIVREKIKEFARQTPRAATGPSSDGKTYPCPPYKIIILDEADSMTQDAQGALRRIMESYAKITRFCLVCNYVTRIIEPLTSRCSKFRFKPLDTSSTSSRLKHIGEMEKLDINEDVIEALVKTSGGDLRRAITYLQSCSRLANATADTTNGKKPEISPSDVQEIAGVVPDRVIDSFAKTLGLDVDTSPGGAGMDIDQLSVAQRAKNFDAVRKHVKELVREGYSAAQILSQLHDLFILHPRLDAKRKSRCALIFGEADKALCDGADEELWILEVAVRVWKVLSP
ncbi:P-loop containing nucleoside triphosphate hydrolase protein [Serendipita vermifera]|nr:P-loop containing nucleoside triphosphate hydrolase protein [Serendipita vermifera]